MTERVLDWARITHLLKIGILASLAVLAGDMILGWGVSDPDVSGLPAFLTRYLSVSDGRIAASALLGLIGIPVECLSWFSVYRMIRPYSEKEAHAYRAGILGCLAFGGCGVHVPCCMAVYLLKRFYGEDPGSAAEEMVRWLGWFLLPATVLFLVFFLLASVTQIKAFGGGHTPLPRRCWVFSVLFGFAWLVIMKLAGDSALANALSAGWISMGSLWMTCGLLIEAQKERKRVLG